MGGKVLSYGITAELLPRRQKSLNRLSLNDLSQIHPAYRDQSWKDTFESEPTDLSPAQLEKYFHVQGNGSKAASFTFQVPQTELVSIDKLAVTWQAVASHHTVLRTILLQDRRGSLDSIVQQAVLKRATPLFFEDQAVGPTRPFLVYKEEDGYQTLTLHVHPALLDETSLIHIVTDFGLFYHGYSVPYRPSFQRYLQETVSKDQALAKSYWQTRFEGCRARNFTHTCTCEPPKLRSQSLTNAGFDVEAVLRNFELSTKLPRAAAIYAALAITLQKHYDTSDVVFHSFQRDDSFLDSDKIVGLLDVNVPIRIALAEDITCLDLATAAWKAVREAGRNAIIGSQEIKNLIPSHVKDCPRVRLLDFGEAFPETHDDFIGLDIQINVMGRLARVQYDPPYCQDELTITLEHFWYVLEQVATDVSKPVSALSLVSPEEEKALLQMSLPLRRDITPKLLHEMVEAQCKLEPLAPAIQFETEQVISYQELNDQADRVSRQLRRLTGAGSIVAMHSDVSTPMIIGLLGILKTGAAYVIIDPNYPAQRKSYILSDTNASICLTSSKYHTELVSLADSNRKVLVVDELLAKDVSPGDSVHNVAVNYSDPAYIVYTSGSTGVPKGASLSHRAASSGLQCSTDNSSTRSLLFYNPVFSAAQRTIWSTLTHGGCLCLAMQQNLLIDLASTINKLQVTDLGITASTIGLLEPEHVPTLKRVRLTGEAMNSKTVSKWASTVQLRNNYGLTECTQLIWGAQISDPARDPQNVGRPQDTTSALILDPGTTKITPLLLPGELCLSGPQIATQYLNQPEQTRQRFIRHPFQPNERLYRTGDLAIRHPDGTITLLGRADDQVKINGQRVEPSEVQNLLSTHAEVASAVVLAANIDDQKSLVAFVQPENLPVWSSLVSSLRKSAMENFPLYMVPTYWIQMETIPLNSNGKIDRRALRDIAEQKSHAELVEMSLSHNTADEDEDLTELEVALRTALSTVLDLPLEVISIHGSFFELGGDSLKAIQVTATLLNSGIISNVRDIMISKSLKQAAALLTVSSRDDSIAPPQPFSLLPEALRVGLEDFEDAYLVTPLQEGVISAHIASGTYVYHRVFKTTGAEMERLRYAFQTVIAENPIYRTIFRRHKSSYLQLVSSRSELPWENREDTTLQEFWKSTKKVDTDLDGPFIKATNLADDVLVVGMHHALFDFWSSSFLFDDVSAVYAGKPVMHRPRFSSFVHHVQNLDAQAAKKFWAEYLQDAHPTRLARETGSFNVSKKQISADLRLLTSRASISIGALIYATWAVILWRHTGSLDVTFAITLSGRDVPIQDVQNLNGPTLVTVPMRIHVDPSKSLLDFARQVQVELWNIAEFSQYGMRNALLASGHKASMFDTMVNFLIRPPQSNEDSVLQPFGERPIWDTGLNSLELEETAPGEFELRFSGQLEPMRTMFIASQAANILDELVSQNATSIEDIKIMGASENAFLDSLSMSGTGVSQLLHRAFEETSTALQSLHCIEFKNESPITYHELNAKANRLARYLVERGVRPDSLVPICLPKSTEQIICILAILKAGGAFVPLDPDNPAERNNFIVRDVSARLVLTNEDYAPIFNGSQDNLRVLDIFDIDCDQYYDANLQVPGLTPENLAYAIYTSGSTGTPKGVLIPHKSISSGIDSITTAEEFEQSWRVLQFSNYIFDVAIGDIFCAFKVGATLCMASSEDLLTDLASVINEMNATHLFLTPTVAKIIQPSKVPNVQGIYLAGEQVPQDLADIWTKHCKVMNCYGPTEASILSVAGVIKPSSSSRVIGMPLKHCSAMILEPNGTNPVPYGAIGELCLGGHQLAREYLNRPEATQKAFITIGSERIYRTGDLACWGSGQQIECFGRKDSQIKINGHRIEIGEVESAILATKILSDTVVTVANIRNKSQIVAFCVVEHGGEPTDGLIVGADQHKELLTSLSLGLSTLAPYMVPSIWIPLKSMPLLPSGKANRRQLTSLVEGMSDSDINQYFAGASQSMDIVEPKTSEQSILRSIWAEIFGIEEETISIMSTFFALGGDSISAINLVGKCRGLSYSLSVGDVMAFPVLQDMAAYLRPLVANVDYPIAPHLEASTQLKSILQSAAIYDSDIQSVWPVVPGIEEFLIRGAAKQQFWQCQTVRPVPTDFDLSSWTELTQRLTAQNDILRSMWAFDNERWVQIVLKDPLLDFQTLQCSSTEHREELALLTWKRVFKAEHGKPFICYRLLETPSTGEKHLLIKIHHAMYDGTLLRIFDDQFKAMYKNSAVPPSVEFSNYVGHMFSASEQQKKDTLDFWVDLLHDAPGPYPVLSEADRSGEISAMFTTQFDSRVDGFAAQCGTTVPIVFQSAFTVLLCELSGKPDVVYDNLITGRNIPIEDAQMINGNCANFLPFRSSLTADTDVRSLLKSTQDLFWKSTEYGSINMTNINKALGPVDATAASRSLFLFQPFEPATGAVKHMRWMVMAGSKVTMPIDYALHLEVSKTITGYSLKFKYDGSLYTSEEAKIIGEKYVSFVDQMISRSFSSISSFDGVSIGFQ